MRNSFTNNCNFTKPYYYGNYSVFTSLVCGNKYGYQICFHGPKYSGFPIMHGVAAKSTSQCFLQTDIFEQSGSARN